MGLLSDIEKRRELEKLRGKPRPKPAMTQAQARRSIMLKFTDPVAARADLIKQAKRHDPLQYRRFLAWELDRAVRGKTRAGAFPHTPNQQIIDLIGGLKQHYDQAYEKLDRQGYASDEKINLMDEMHHRVRSGSFPRGL